MGERQKTDLSAEFAPTIRDPNNLQGLGDQFLNERNQMAQGFGQAMGNIENTDPEQHMRLFQNWTDPLSQAVSGPTSQLQQALNAQATLAAEDAGQAAGSQFANQGALNSSAGMSAMGKAMAQPFAQAQLQTQQNQLGLTGNLWNQAMGTLNQQTLAQQQAQQNAAQMYANQMNQLGGQAANIKGQSFSMMEPNIVTEPNAWDKIIGGLGDVVNIGSGIAGMATGLGALGGGGGGGMPSYAGTGNQQTTSDFSHMSAPSRNQWYNQTPQSNMFQYGMYQ